jgi:hypothetical protein
MPYRIMCKDYQQARRQRDESRTENLIEKKKAFCEQSMLLRNEEQRKKTHPPDDKAIRSKW